MNKFDVPPNESLSSRQITDLLLASREVYQPPLSGNFYDTFLLNLEALEQPLMMKLLKDNKGLPESEQGKDRAVLFSKHQIEYQEMQDAFSGTNMVLPTVFLSDYDNGQFVSIQTFITEPVFQYKLWERNGQRTPPLGELQRPIQEAAKVFMERTQILFDRIHPNVVDVDFFILDQEPWIIIFDTSHFWPDKLEGKDRMRKEHTLQQFWKELLSES